MNLINDIKEKIDDYIIKPHHIFTKEYGEVFTPDIIINNMLDLIPEKTWNDPNLKFGDFCVGIGNFTIHIVKRLMEGLKTSFKSEESRYKHIIENMIYVCDLQEKNCEMFIKLFNPDNKYKLNILFCDFLSSDFDKQNVNTFDFIISNPPYNGKTDINKTNGNIIWDKFVIKSLALSDNICFVHPSLWRKPMKKNSKIKDLLTIFKQYNLIFLKINSLVDGKKIFDSGTRFDYYFLSKNGVYNKTTIVDEDDIKYNIDIKNLKFIPNKDINNVLKYFDIESKLEIIFDSAYHSVRDYVSDIKNTNYKYPLIHSTPKSGIVYKYSKINNKGHFNVPKVILGEGGIYNALIDIDGKFGMTQGAIGIKIKTTEEGEKILKFLKSDVFSHILKCCSWSNFRIDSNLIKLLVI